MKNLAILLIALLATLRGSSAILGLDAINSISTSEFACLRNNGYSFFFGRLQLGDGSFDSIGVQNLRNAAAGVLYYEFCYPSLHIQIFADYEAGLDTAAYIFPCVNSGNCPSAAAQINATITRIRAEQIPLTLDLWIDIEGTWPSDQGTNRRFLLDMLLQAETMGWANQYVGIYTTRENWASIFGADFVDATIPLWWPRYNGIQDLTTDWQPFGGWTRPTYHQFSQNFNGPCGVTFDQNFG